MNYNKSFALLNGFTLKLIALVSMTADHAAVALVDRAAQPELYDTLRGIGRLAFPIFCFLIVEGFLHTGDVKKYLIRLFIFGLLSEIPFDMLLYGIGKTIPYNMITDMSPGLYMRHQNVYFTLALGLLGLCCIKQYEKRPLMNIIVVIITASIAYIMKTDYSYLGILQIMFFYYMRESVLYKTFAVAFLNACMNQPLGAAALIFTNMYNGRRGPHIRYVMYAYYPVHLLVLSLIRNLCL